MGKLQHYLSLILFAAALMLGVQAPNFIDQYVKRVDAHYREAKVGFQYIQQTADIYHQGSVERLIAKHRDSADVTFRSEAAGIENNYNRLQLLASEVDALKGNVFDQLVHIVFAGDRGLLSETQQHYTANVPLNVTAGIFGLITAVLVSIGYELVCSLMAFLFGRNNKVVTRSPY
jgi:hypothetical protein